jgi:hypothetical protein
MQQIEKTYSPSAFQALLQTSTVQVSNGSNGAAMTLIKKRDVQNYRASRPHKALRPFRPANATGKAPLTDSATAQAAPSAPVFVADFLLEHSSSIGSVLTTAFAVTAEENDAGVVPPAGSNLQV